MEIGEQGVDGGGHAEQLAALAGNPVEHGVDGGALQVGFDGSAGAVVGVSGGVRAVGVVLEAVLKAVGGPADGVGGVFEGFGTCDRCGPGRQGAG
ncbi:MAG: hypothetical protein AAF823_14620 [Planctomycetota bacterium]